MLREGGQHIEALFAMLKKADIVNLIAIGASAPLPFASPLLQKTAARVDADEEAEPPIPGPKFGLPTAESPANI
eukprot:2201287-Pleurochrysis_carterae.AAC.1